MDFRDLRVMKERFIFADSHDDDVTKLEFHPDFSTLLLSGSLDGILCLFDLAKENEEEAIEASEFTNKNNKNSFKFHDFFLK